jgi:hypothetical protein
VSKGEKVPKKNFAADFRAEKSQEGLRRKRNDRRCPIKLGPRILKIVAVMEGQGSSSRECTEKMKVDSIEEH